jgi:hypothetical protein
MLKRGRDPHVLISMDTCIFQKEDPRYVPVLALLNFEEG